MNLNERLAASGFPDLAAKKAAEDKDDDMKKSAAAKAAAAESDDDDDKKKDDAKAAKADDGDDDDEHKKDKVGGKKSAKASKAKAEDDDDKDDDGDKHDDDDDDDKHDDDAEDDDDDDKKSKKAKGKRAATSHREIALAERHRIAAIFEGMTDPAQLELASELAFGTDLTPSAAVKILTKYGHAVAPSPKASSEKNPLVAAMAHIPSPTVTTAVAASSGSVDERVQFIMGASKKRDR